MMARGRAMSGEWISVEDRLPEDGQRVLLLTLSGWVKVGEREMGEWYLRKGQPRLAFLVLCVTHWQPLPPPPNIPTAP